MSSVSFDNVWLLLILIPALAALVVPFVLAVRKENAGVQNVVSFVAHILIAVLVVMAIAGTKVTAVMTETEVYVVADVSYSANRNLDTVDEYVLNVKNALPRNSKLGLVCFAKDAQLLVEAGGELASVQTADVDASATDIAGALEYTADLFTEDAIKRIVLITDGKQTGTDSSVRAVVEGLNARGIYVDALYLDDNIKDGDTEVEITGVEFSDKVYLNHRASVSVQIRSSFETQAVVRLYRNGTEVAATVPEPCVSKGVTLVEFELDTSLSGTYDYEVKVEAEGDESPYNNGYSFTQQVTGLLNVMLVTASTADAEAIEELYGPSATVAVYDITKTRSIPCTLEEICRFDEIMLADVDVREIPNVTSFIDAVETAVSKFGKSLVTFGDLKIQNRTDDALTALEDMLPVNFGNNDQDPKLLALVIDNSHSMNQASRLAIAKAAAKELVSQLSLSDYVAIYAFSGSVEPVFTSLLPIGSEENREAIMRAIDNMDHRHGTVISSGLEETYKLIKDNAAVSSKQVMLISDGRASSEEDIYTSVEIAAKMYADDGIVTSVINAAYTVEDSAVATLQNIAKAGLGKYYLVTSEDAVEVVLEEVKDDISEAVIEGESAVTIKRAGDDAVEGVTGLSAIYGYVYGKAELSATTVITAAYVKESGSTVDAPVYTYWNYGNGRVAVFTSAVTGDWIKDWGNVGDRLFRNLLTSNTPSERTDAPFLLSLSGDGTTAEIMVTPAQVTAYGTAEATITLPSGETVTRQIALNEDKNYVTFETPLTGRYQVVVRYEGETGTFTATRYLNVSYAEEYDAFVAYDASVLSGVLPNGNVWENGAVVLENDAAEVTTYEFYFTLPFLIAAVVLFVADVVVRKLKWSDIKSLFGKKG